MAAEEPERIAIDGRPAFRWSSYDTPFWSDRSSEAQRWHVQSDGPTQYLALHPDGAWAELLRHEGLRTEAECDLIRMPIWVAHVSAKPIADYSTFDVAAAAGFAPEALVDEDYSRCQAEGARLRGLGYAGVLAPSPALPDVRNLTLFGPRMLSRIDRQAPIAVCIPAARAAVGRPPPGVAARVRHLGASHPGLEEFRRRSTRRRRRRG